MDAPPRLVSTFTDTPISRISKHLTVPVQRGVANFVFGSTGALLTANLLDVEVWKLSISAGVGALVNYAYRKSERWLRSHPEED